MDKVLSFLECTVNVSEEAHPGIFTTSFCFVSTDFLQSLFYYLISQEMVLDKENEKIHPRYLVYDIIQFQVGVIFLKLQLISLCDLKTEQILPLERAAAEVSFEW